MFTLTKDTFTFYLRARNDCLGRQAYQLFFSCTIDRSGRHVHNSFPQLVVHVVCDSSAANGSLAQLVEQRTLNPSVQGSNPCVPTIPSLSDTICLCGNVAQLVEQRTLNPSVQGSNPCVPTIPSLSDTICLCGNVAQLVEQRTLNPSVQGSNPCVPTTPPNDPADRWSAGFFSFLSSLPAVIPQASAHFPALSLPLRRTTGKLSEPSPLRFIRT